jgi:hypothetical protein
MKNLNFLFRVVDVNSGSTEETIAERNSIFGSGSAVVME